MKISELLQEANLQAILKSGFKADGTIIDLVGPKAEAVAAALECKPEDKVYIYRAGTPAQVAALKSVLATRPHAEQGGIRTFRLTGGSKVVNVDDKLITCAYQFSKLVEHAAD